MTLMLKICLIKLKTNWTKNGICQFCPLQTVENEPHLLCTCSLYTILGTSMYNNLCQRCKDFANMNDGETFYHLIRNERRETANLID